MRHQNVTSPVAPVSLADIPEWQPGLKALQELPTGAVALILGNTDRGKTTFVTLAARALAARLTTVALVDSDIGQSEIGPPGTVGVACARADRARLGELKPLAEFFVGAFSPQQAALELVVATAQAVRWMRERGADRILVDTTGYVNGPAARRLKVAKAQALQPTLVITLGYPEEMASLAQAVVIASGASLVSLPVPEGIGKKSSTLRATRRMTRLAAALHGSVEIGLPLAQTSTVGATLGTGSVVAPELVRWCAETLALPVVHAEQTEGALTLFSSVTPAQTRWEASAGIVSAHFSGRPVRVLSLENYPGVLVGLQDVQGHLLGIGRFVGLDPRRQEIVVSAPGIRGERVRLVAFGRVRLKPDGSPDSEVKAGEI